MALNSLWILERKLMDKLMLLMAGSHIAQAVLRHLDRVMLRLMAVEGQVFREVARQTLARRRRLAVRAVGMLLLCQENHLAARIDSYRQARRIASRNRERAATNLVEVAHSLIVQLAPKHPWQLQIDNASHQEMQRSVT